MQRVVSAIALVALPVALFIMFLGVGYYVEVGQMPEVPDTFSLVKLLDGFPKFSGYWATYAAPAIDRIAGISDLWRGVSDFVSFWTALGNTLLAVPSSLYVVAVFIFYPLAVIARYVTIVFRFAFGMV